MAHLDFWVAYRVFLFVCILLTWISVGLIFLKREDGRSCCFALLFFLFACLSQGFLLTLRTGQVSILVFALLSLTWFAQKKGALAWSGVFLGLACTLKLFPGLAILAFLAMGRWKTALWAMGIFFSVALFMGLGFGLESWSQFLGQQEREVGIWMHNATNQSLHGIFYGSFSKWLGEPTPWTLKFTTALALFLAFAVLWEIRRQQVEPHHDFLLSVGLSVLISQRAWPHYDVILLLPLFFLCSQALSGSFPWGKWGWAFLFLLLLSHLPNHSLAETLSVGLRPTDASWKLGATVAMGALVWLPDALLVLCLGFRVLGKESTNPKP